MCSWLNLADPEDRPCSCFPSTGITSMCRRGLQSCSANTLTTEPSPQPLALIFSKTAMPKNVRFVNFRASSFILPVYAVGQGMLQLTLSQDYDLRSQLASTQISPLWALQLRLQRSSCSQRSSLSNEAPSTFEPGEQRSPASLVVYLSLKQHLSVRKRLVWMRPRSPTIGYITLASRTQRFSCPPLF